TGASGGGQNRAEQHPIPIHPSGSPSPPRAIQNKLLIAISESRKSRRNSVHYPVNAGLSECCDPSSFQGNRSASQLFVAMTTSTVLASTRNPSWRRNPAHRKSDTVSKVGCSA